MTDHFTKHDREVGSKAQLTTQLYVIGGLIVWYSVLNNRYHAAVSTSRSPPFGEWLLRVTAEGLLVEVTAAVALVIVPTFAVARRHRRTGLLSPAGTGPLARQAFRISLVEVAVGLISGIVLLTLARFAMWPVLVATAAILLSWVVVSRSFELSRFATQPRATSSDDAWPNTLRTLTADDIVTWTRHQRHYTSALGVQFSRSRNRDHIYATDTVDDLPPDQLRALLAHNVGHVRLGHYRTLQRVQFAQRAAGGFIGVWMVMIADSDGSHDPMSYALFRFAMFATAILTTLVLSRWRRSLETAADEHSLSVTANPQAFKDMIVTMTLVNKAAVSGLGASNACGGTPPEVRMKLADDWAAAHPSATQP